MSTSDHPDLRQTIANAIDELRQTQEFQTTQLQEPVRFEQIEIRCQQVIRNVRTLNEKIDGGDLAASIALVTQGTSVYPWLFVICRPAGEENWQPVASVSGEGHEREPGRFLGKTGDPRSFVCVGSLNVIPDGGRVSVELPNGNVHDEHATGGCCVVLAPVTSAPDINRPTTIRYFDPDGRVMRMETLETRSHEN
jgi:hypothetical protein